MDFATHCCIAGTLRDYCGCTSDVKVLERSHIYGGSIVM